MKRIATAGLALIIFSAGLFTQSLGQDKKFSLYMSLGYGFGIGGVSLVDTVHFTAQTLNASGNLIKQEDHYLNYGSGFKATGGAQYRIMDNVDARLEFQYTGGVPKLKIKNTDPTNAPGPTEITDTYTRNIFGVRLLALPAFRLLDLIDMHAGVGIGLFFGSFTYETSGEPYDGNLKTLPAFAFSGVLDADYPVAEFCSIFGGFTFDAMNFTVESHRSPQNAVVTHYEQNSIAPNEPIPPKIPGSNWAITAGVRFPLF
jgi:hypothetical protein